MKEHASIDRLFARGLQGHEVHPPQGSFDRLMERMDESHHPVDRLFKRAAEVHSEAPGYWVKEELQARMDRKRRRRVLVWWYSSGMVATVFLAFMAGYLARPGIDGQSRGSSPFAGLPDPISTSSPEVSSHAKASKPLAGEASLALQAQETPKESSQQGMATAPSQPLASAPQKEGNVRSGYPSSDQTPALSNTIADKPSMALMEGEQENERVALQPVSLIPQDPHALVQEKWGMLRPEPSQEKENVVEEWTASGCNHTYTPKGWYVQAHAGPLYAWQNASPVDKPAAAPLFGPNMGFREQPINGIRLGVQTGKFIGRNIALFSGLQYQRFGHYTPRSQLQSLPTGKGNSGSSAPVVTSAGLVEGLTASIDNNSVQGSDPYLSVDQVMSDPMERLVQEFALVSVPIGIRAEFGRGLVRFTSSAALEPGVLVSNRVFAENNRSAIEIGRTSGIRDVHLAARIGAGFHVTPGRHWSFGFEPSLSYSLTDWSNTSDTQMRPIFFAANLNLVYQLF